MGSIRLKKKSTVPIYRIHDKLYLATSGTATEIPDPSGSIEYFLQAMDGTRTLEEIYAAMRPIYPEVTFEDLLDAVEQFDHARFLEDGDATPGDMLDEYDITRWNRNINFLGSFITSRENKYRLQYQLKTARVALLGLGGLGSHLLYDLAALGVLDIRATDFDRVELANLNRQILYNESDVGRLKADVAAERIAAFNSRVKLEVFSDRLSSSDDVFRLIQDRDYVLCVADRPKMEIHDWVNNACVRCGVPLIVGGLDTQRALYWSIIPGITGCLECWRRQVLPSDAVSASLLAEKRRLEIRGDNTAFVPFVSLITGLMLAELVRMITGIAPPVAAGRSIAISFDTMETREVERWERLASCPVCQAVVPRSQQQELMQLHTAG